MECGEMECGEMECGWSMVSTVWKGWSVQERMLGLAIDMESLVELGSEAFQMVEQRTATGNMQKHWSHQVVTMIHPLNSIHTRCLIHMMKFWNVQFQMYIELDHMIVELWFRVDSGCQQILEGNLSQYHWMATSQDWGPLDRQLDFELVPVS